MAVDFDEEVAELDAWLPYRVPKPGTRKLRLFCFHWCACAGVCRRGRRGPAGRAWGGGTPREGLSVAGSLGLGGVLLPRVRGMRRSGGAPPRARASSLLLCCSAASLRTRAPAHARLRLRRRLP